MHGRAFPDGHLHAQRVNRTHVAACRADPGAPVLVVCHARAAPVQQDQFGELLAALSVGNGQGACPGVECVVIALGGPAENLHSRVHVTARNRALVPGPARVECGPRVEWGHVAYSARKGLRRSFTASKTFRAKAGASSGTGPSEGIPISTRS